ncbi:hypothetical protein LFM09_46635 [Lentzea alba]|uniref:hypothetical protein n=1 Tax=Lentzea alba TaxID=2714351 RepID=UPI0039BEDA12
MKAVLKGVVAAAAATALLSGMVAGTASAGVRGDYDGSAVRVRTQPKLNATVLGLGYRGNGLCAYRVVSGDPVNGNYAWIDHKNLSRPIARGYSHADLIVLFGGTSC